MEIIPDHSSGNTKCKEKLLHSIYATKGDITEYSIAECMFLLYKDEFIYYNEWYLVSNGKKINIKNGTELRKRIPILKIFIDEEVTRIRVQIRIYEKDLDKIDDVEEKEEHTIQLKNKIKQLDNTRTSLLHAKTILDKTGFKNNVMTECKDLFLQSQMIEHNTDNEQVTIESDEIITNSFSSMDLAIIEKLNKTDWRVSNTYKRLHKIISDLHFKKVNIISQKVKEYFIRNNVKVEEDKKHGHKIYIEY